jgi:hypothetical protein
MKTLLILILLCPHFLFSQMEDSSYDDILKKKCEKGDKAACDELRKNNTPTVIFPLDESGNVEFKKIISLDTVAKNDIFYGSRRWVADVFKSAQDVIQYENLDDGKIIGKGIIQITPTGYGFNGTISEINAGHISFTFEIIAKNYKCRIRIYNIVHTATYSGGDIDNLQPRCGVMYMTLKTWQSIQRSTLIEIDNLLTNFSTALKKQKLDDNW